MPEVSFRVGSRQVKQKFSFANISVKHKLNCIFLLMFFFISAIVGINILSSRSNTSYTQLITDNLLPSIRASSEIQIGLLNVISLFEQYTLIGDKSLIEERISIWNKKVRKPFEELKKLSVNWTDPTLKAKMQKAEDLIIALKGIQSQLELIVHTPDNIPAERILMKEILPLGKIMAKEITKMINMEIMEYASPSRKELLGNMEGVRETLGLYITNMQGFLQTGDIEYAQEADVLLEQFYSQRAGLFKNHFLLMLKQEVSFKLFEKHRLTLMEKSEVFYKLRKSHDWNKAIFLLKSQVIPVQDDLKHILGTISQINQDLLDTSRVEQGKTTQRYTVLEFCVFITLLAVMILASQLLGKIIVQPLVSLSHRANRLSPRLAHKRYSHQSDKLESNLVVHDEVKHLSNSFEEMEKEIVTQVKMIEEQNSELEKEVKERTQLNQELEARIKERTESLKKAKEGAEQANQSKSEFLANMSHEIRTPINAIVGMIHLTQQSELSSKQNAYLEKIKSSTNLLLGIINDILDFSKIETGEMKLESIPFLLNEVLAIFLILPAFMHKKKGWSFYLTFRQIHRCLL